MKNSAEAHQILCGRYPQHIPVDTMIPHTYSPAQMFFLDLVLNEGLIKVFTKQTLHAKLAAALGAEKIKFEDLTNELRSNPLILAWIRDLTLSLSYRNKEEVTQCLREFFPFNMASINVIQLVFLAQSL